MNRSAETRSSGSPGAGAPAPGGGRPLAEFVNALAAAAAAGAFPPDTSDRGRAAVREIRAALSGPRDAASVRPARLGACRHLGRALANARRGPGPAARLADAFAPLADRLHWRLRPPEEGEDPAFRSGHANADVIGPAGLERHVDVVVGVSLLAPGVTFPDHRHPPEEIYVAMSAGDWFEEDAGWRAPGIGGLIHHRPGVVHAMRSGEEPLLAFWILRRP